MAFLPIHNRPASPLMVTLSDLSARLTAAFSRRADRPRRSPEEILAAQARRETARAAVDRLMRQPH